jgi:hypothetical protein
MAKEEKEEKPKKAFEIKVIIWDDGEIDSELYEYRQNPSGRGAPGKWRLSANDFTRRMEETLGDPQLLLDATYDAIGGLTLELQDAKKTVGSVINNAQVTVVKEETEPKPSKKKKDTDLNTDLSSTDDVDFGDFDDKKDK